MYDLFYFDNKLILSCSFSIIAIFVVIWLIFKKKKEIEKEFMINEPHKEALESVIKQLRQRAVKLKKNSFFILLLLFVIILGGMTIFILSSRITEELYNHPYVRGLEKEKLNFEKKNNKLESDILSFEKKISDLENDSDKSDLKKISDLTNKIEKNNNKIDENRNKIDENRSKIYDIDEKAFDFYKNGDNIEGLHKGAVLTLVHSLGTKIGIVLLLLYFAKILVTTYRYNLKLASFYDARADCLQVSEKDTAKDLNDYSNFFSSDFIDLYKIHELPMETLAKDLLKEKVKEAKKQVTKKTS